MSKVSPQAPVPKEPVAKPPERRRATADREHDGIRIHISRRAYIILYTIILAPVLVGVGVFVGGHKWNATAKTEAVPAIASGLQPAVPTVRTYLNPGPWGTVEFVPFELTFPEEFLSV